MGLFDGLQKGALEQARANNREVRSDLDRQRAEEPRRAFEAYVHQRQADIGRALSRRISTGDAGLPFLVIDTIFATVVLGEEKYEKANIGAALEGVKDKLWAQCRHLGGDAVLHADFKFERGRYSFTSKALLVMNALTAAMRMGSGSSTVEQDTVTIVGQGTAVKLLPTGTALSPQVYEQFDQKWLDLRLPPGINEPPSLPIAGDGSPTTDAAEITVVERGTYGRYEYEVLSNGRVRGAGRNGIQEYLSLGHFKAAVG